MAYDPGLTREKAVERIGELMHYSEAYEPRFFSLDPGVLLEHNGRLYDATWTLSSDSSVVKALKKWRDAQRSFGFSSPEAIEFDRDSCVALRRTGIFAFVSGYANDAKRHEVFCEYNSLNSDQAARATIHNAIEHGSDYCERGPVKVRFRGGMQGALLDVTDPWNGYTMKPLSVEEILAIHEKSNRRFMSKPRNYKELMTAKRDVNGWSHENLSRGYGSICLTLSKTLVNAEICEEGHRVLLLYDPEEIPEWRK